VLLYYQKSDTQLACYGTSESDPLNYSFICLSSSPGCLCGGPVSFWIQSIPSSIESWLGHPNDARINIGKVSLKLPVYLLISFHTSPSNSLSLLMQKENVLDRWRLGLNETNRIGCYLCWWSLKFTKECSNVNEYLQSTTEVTSCQIASTA
jgi:hypothetical protein